MENGVPVTEHGYVTDVITDKALEFIDSCDGPYCLMYLQKAPHRNWLPAVRHLDIIKKHVAKMTPPATLHDDWSNRPEFLRHNGQSVGWNLCNWNDVHLQLLFPTDCCRQP